MLASANMIKLVADVTSTPYKPGSRTIHIQMANTPFRVLTCPWVPRDLGPPASLGALVPRNVKASARDREAFRPERTQRE